MFFGRGARRVLKHTSTTEGFKSGSSNNQIPSVKLSTIMAAFLVSSHAYDKRGWPRLAINFYPTYSRSYRSVGLPHPCACIMHQNILLLQIQIAGLKRIIMPINRVLPDHNTYNSCTFKPGHAHDNTWEECVQLIQVLYARSGVLWKLLQTMQFCEFFLYYRMNSDLICSTRTTFNPSHVERCKIKIAVRQQSKRSHRKISASTLIFWISYRYVPVENQTIL